MNKKFKKCDYCKFRHTDTKRYKTANKFLEGKKEHECGKTIMNVDQSYVVHLCDVCYDTIIPTEARVTDNKIDCKWYEDNNINKLLGKRILGLNRIAYRMIPS